LQELVDIVFGALNGTSQKKDDLNDFLVLGNPVIEWLSVFLWLVVLVPVLNSLGRFQDVTSSSVDGVLDLIERWLKDAGVSVKVDIYLKEWLQVLLWRVSSSANSLFHLVERVFGCVEQSLIHRPVVVLGQLLDLLSRDWLNVLVQLVGANGLDQVVDGSFDLVVLALELLGLLSDPDLLHFDEVVEGEGLGVLWQVDEHSLGEGLQVVLNSVLHDVIDVDDQLLELGKSLVDVVQVSINVHGGPGEGDHTWSEFVLQVLKMGNQKTLGVWSDLVHDSVVLSQDELQFVVVVLELVLLEKNDLGTLWDVNSNSGKTLGLSDESKDLRVKVDVQLVVLWMSDYQSGLKSSLSLLNLMSPLLSPQVLVGEQSVSNSVVHLHEFSGFSGLDQVLRELLHWARNSVEQVSGPGDGSRDSWQVSHDLGVALELLILLLDSVDLGSILSEENSVLGVQAVLQVVSVENRFEFSEKLE